MNYIKNLEFKFFTNFGRTFLTVDYVRNGEHNHITFCNMERMKQSEKAVRKFLNN